MSASPNSRPEWEAHSLTRNERSPINNLVLQSMPGVRSRTQDHRRPVITNAPNQSAGQARRGNIQPHAETPSKPIRSAPQARSQDPNQRCPRDSVEHWTPSPQSNRSRSPSDRRNQPRNKARPDIASSTRGKDLHQRAPPTSESSIAAGSATLTSNRPST